MPRSLAPLAGTIPNCISSQDAAFTILRHGYGAFILLGTFLAMILMRCDPYFGRRPVYCSQTTLLLARCAQTTRRHQKQTVVEMKTDATHSAATALH